jgi:hypothetical protein
MESLYFHPEEEGLDGEDSTINTGPPSKSLDNEGEDTKNNENED